jgi:hypothetical protein
VPGPVTFDWVPQRIHWRLETSPSDQELTSSVVQYLVAAAPYDIAGYRPAIRSYSEIVVHLAFETSRECLSWVIIGADHPAARWR